MKGKRVLKRQRNNDSLLGTYFASLFSVMLCFVMLLGTTFAWFYSDNTSVGNEIHSGILKVDMLHVTAGGDKISLAEQPEHQVFSSGALWTPDDSTRTAIVEVRNTGNVPLDYKLDFVPVPNTLSSARAAGLFTVYVNGGRVGSLYDFLSDADDRTDDFCLAVWQGQEEGLGPDDAPHSIQIELQMDTVGAHSVMGQKVPLYLKLEAYQHLAGPSELKGGEEQA